MVAAFGIATATAAASGFFGAPVYVPVVSDALAKAKLVELPQKDFPKPKAKPAVVSKEMVPAKPETELTPNGRQAVRALYQRLRTDPEFRALPRQERLAIARQEIETMLEKGEVTLPELRRALAEHRLLQNPAIRRKIGRELARREMAQRKKAATGAAVEDKAAIGNSCNSPGLIQPRRKRDAKHFVNCHPNSRRASANCASRCGQPHLQSVAPSAANCWPSCNQRQQLRLKHKKLRLKTKGMARLCVEYLKAVTNGLQ